MIGRIFFKSFRLAETDSGDIELTLSVAPECKYAAKQIARELRQNDKDFMATIDTKKSKRSLDQNSLMWALLTIYAESQGGGRRGSVQPEDIYMRMLSKYGIAEFLVVPCEAVEGLKRAYKDTVVLDDAVIERNGRRTPAKAVKCLIGSSQYDTAQMSQLIDGIFDELAVIGVSASTSRDVAAYYEDWNVRAS